MPEKMSTALVLALYLWCVFLTVGTVGLYRVCTLLFCGGFFRSLVMAWISDQGAWFEARLSPCPAEAKFGHSIKQLSHVFVVLELAPFC